MALNEIGGTNFAKGILEWTLPPLRFRRFGVLSLYCNWTQLSFFSGGIVTNLKDPAGSQTWTDLGAQLEFRLVMFSLLESTLSTGYAVAHHSGIQSDEFMISLRLLK